MRLRIYWGGISFGDDCCSKPLELTCNSVPTPKFKLSLSEIEKPYYDRKRMME